MRNPEMDGFAPEQPREEKSRYVVGAKQNPDGSWNYSKAMVMLPKEKPQKAIEGAKQMHNEAGQGSKLEMQLNEIYAQKYENYAKFARERIVGLEQKLNEATSEEEKQSILAKIVEERNFVIEMEEEAKHRRSY